MNNPVLRTLLLLALLFATFESARASDSHRMYDGVTAFVDNSQGREFTVSLDVRDFNIYESGPRELLVKVYDPDGKPLVREVIEDDGVTSQNYLPPIAAWDHEAWYYTYCYMQGTQPMLRWSAPSSPDRQAAAPKRTFTYKVPASGKGVYRVLVVGAIDHYVTLTVDPQLPRALAGHTDWLHGHGEMWRKSHVYVPRGVKGVHLLLAEFDVPRSRQVTLKAPDGSVLGEVAAPSGVGKLAIDFDPPGKYDDQVLTVEVSPGPGDFLVNAKLRFPVNPEVKQRGEPVVPGIFAPDAATAKALRGGAIYHDDRVFWHGYQVRLHDWLKKLKPEDLEIKNEAGEAVLIPPPRPMPGQKPSTAKLAEKPGFITINGPYFAAPPCDTILYSYPVHKNRAALNVAIKDLIAGLRSVGPNDHVAVAVGGPFANMGYEFSNYAFPYWRPAWRLLQETDAPEEVKAGIREALLVCGDRLNFCRSWERVNGNSYAQVLSALRYCYAGTKDELQEKLFDTYWKRFTTGGWGSRVGVGPSGPVQEGFAYSHHYGSYILTTWQSVLGDFHDPRMQQVHDRIHNLISYTLAEENQPTGPWSARTKNYPHWQIEREGNFAWKGLPGPDFTTNINDGNEFFAARRKNYYAVTYHGRLSPKWESNAHSGQAGYGGGMLCQLHIPGRGPVIASTVNGDYGEGMHPSQWPAFHLHTVVGQTADGKPLVSGDSEHLDAKLEGNTVTSSGEVREQTVNTQRKFTFEDDAIACELQLRETIYDGILSLWVKSPLRGKVTKAYEMIPFVPTKSRTAKPPGPTVVKVLGATGDETVELSTEPVLARQVIIDRGGFGVKIELEEPRRVLRGENNTVLIELTSEPKLASLLGLKYKLRGWAE